VASQRAITPYFWFALALALLAIWRHRSNLQRLRAGTENKFTRKPKSSPVADSKESNPGEEA
jgi:hypothetical protein